MRERKLSRLLMHNGFKGILQPKTKMGHKGALFVLKSEHKSTKTTHPCVEADVWRGEKSVCLNGATLTQSNKVVILVLFPYKKYSRRFITVRLNH